MFIETRINLGGDSVVPDLIVYRWSKVPLTASQRVAADFFTPPDTAVEISSPVQTRKDLIDRCRWYIQNDVEIALPLNPRNETVKLFRVGTLADRELLA